MTWAEPLGAPIEGEARRRTKVEIWIALAVFPLPALITALVLLVRSAVEGTEPSQISRVLPRHDALSSVLGSVLYTTSGAGVLVAAFFLTSGGIRLRDLGVRRDGLGRDLRYAFGIVGAGLGINFVLALIIVASFGKNGIPGSFSAKDQHFPTVFLLQGYVVSIVTATVEEGVINAYLLTRFGQLGWTPRKALWVSMVLRTSYHAYYGVGFLLTVPVGWVLTRSFQRHRRVLRVIAAHAVYDALLFTIAILAS